LFINKNNIEEFPGSIIRELLGCQLITSYKNVH